MLSLARYHQYNSVKHKTHIYLAEHTRASQTHTCAMKGAIIPPIRLKDVQKPIPIERTDVG